MGATIAYSTDLVNTARSQVRRLDRSLLSGLAWTGAGRAAVQALTWVTTLLVARLLTPQDFGIAGMASLFLWAIQALGEFGLGSALLKHRDLTEEQIAQLNGLSLLLGFASAAVVCAAAGPLAVFFAAPELHAVLPVTSLTFPLSGLRTVPSALLQRELRFRRLALNDTVQGIATAGSIFALALAGLGYWSLVVGHLVGFALGTAVLIRARPHRLAFPRADATREATTFGQEVLVSRFAWYAMFNTDFVVAGRVMGKTALGYYNIAWSIASLPVEKISLLVTRVAMPLLAAVQDSREAMRRYVLVMTEGLAVATFPAAFGIALIAGDLVPWALGEKWRLAATPLRLLALGVPIRSVGVLLPQIVPVLGRTRFGMRHAVVSAVVMAVAFIIGSRWGITGIAATWVLVYPLTILPLLLMVLRALDAPFRRYVEALRPALTGSAIMAAVVLGFLAAADDWTAGARVAGAVGLGAVAYGLALGTLHRSRVLATLGVIRRGGSPPA